MGDDRGSALVLVPACVLVVMALGAIAVDLSARFLVQREAIAASEAAANDAAAAGIDLDDLDGPGPIGLDPAAVEGVVWQSLATQEVADELIGRPVVELVDPTTVRVTVRIRARPVFSSVFTDLGGGEVVTASATAHVVVR